MYSIKEIKSKLKNIFNPIPSLDEEAHKFMNMSFKNISFRQIKEILRLILDEVEKSRKFGLFIRDEDLFEEELIFLAFIEGMGGVSSMIKKVSYENVQRILDDMLDEKLKEKFKYYFEKSRKKNESVKNKYNCHVFCTKSRILQEIYSVKNRNLIDA